MVAWLAPLKTAFATCTCCRRYEEESLEPLHWTNTANGTHEALRHLSERVTGTESQLQMVLNPNLRAFADDSHSTSVDKENDINERVRFREIDIRFQLLETANYAGVLMWKILDYESRKAQAVARTVVSLYSQPFYTSQFGYKMCAKVYLNGDGMGKGSHLSLFFVIMKGNYDALLAWPFQMKVTMTVLDQVTGKHHIADSFMPDPNGPSFKRPKTEMNVASGCPLFLLQSVLGAGPYIRDDTIFLKVTVDTDGIKDP